jgi:hypothetical protein
MALKHNLRIYIQSSIMHLGEISFCDNVGFNIKSEDIKKKILHELEEVYNFKIIQKHYERFTDAMLPMLNKNPHLVSTRTNGNPYLLYLTRHNFVNQTVFIDKKVQHGYFYPRMINTKLSFKDEMYQNTLFDGEMVKDKDGKWVYIINDIIADSGRGMDTFNIVKRVNRVYDIMQNAFVVDPMDICALQVKRYFRYDEMQWMLNDFIPNLNYSVRGIYFKPLFLKFKDVLFNFDDTLIKKVVRTKYKEVSTFLLPSDKERLMDPPKAMSTTAHREMPVHSSEQKQDVDVQKQTTCRKTQDNNAHKDITSFMQKPLEPTPTNETSTSIMYIQRTSQPDIYDVIDPNTGKQQGQASVNSLQQSKMLRTCFMNATPTDKYQFQCIWSTKFNKWSPQHPAKLG